MPARVPKPDRKAAVRTRKAVPKRSQAKKTKRPRQTREMSSRSRRRWDLAFWGVVAIGVIVGLALVPWSDVAQWIDHTVNSIWSRLGWGIAIIALAVGTIAGTVRRHRLSLLVRHWNHWLGGLMLLVAGWALLAVFDAGGRVGEIILGNSGAAGYARIGGLLAAALFLVVPEAAYHVTVKPVQWFRNRPVRPSLPDGPPTDSTQGQTPSVTVLPGPSPKPAAAEPPAPEAPATSQKARDVWEKFVRTAQTADGWQLPPVDILDRTGEVEFGQADNMQRAKLIEEALASYGVDSKVVQINAGPTVTQFGVEPGWDRKTKQVKEKDRDGNVHVRVKETGRTRVKVDRISSLSNDLALALAAPSIRIEAPVPGKSVVGIEVPNVTSTAVNLRGVIETNNFQKILGRSGLALALGKGAGGEAEASDLGKMPHLLIAGATGSGKTVCLNSIICCLLLHNTPNDLRLIMIDPKRVELTPYDTIPHLAVPVIVKTDRALDALRWLNQEMDKRYQQLARAGARNIDGYNKNKHGKDRLPFLVLVIDELADLMLAGFDEVEHILCRLAQLSRAVGIHLVVATQRPSVDVVTGLIKANFPTRISFAVTSQVDSRTILDGAGAEKLLGRGDMLFMPTEAAKPKRLQGCFVSDAESERLVYFWGSQKNDEMGSMGMKEALESASVTKVREAPRDQLLEAAKQLAREHESISTSFLQRRLQIGYPRAARLKEQLDEALAAERNEQEAGARQAGE